MHLWGGGPQFPPSSGTPRHDCDSIITRVLAHPLLDETLLRNLSTASHAGLKTSPPKHEADPLSVKALEPGREGHLNSPQPLSPKVVLVIGLDGFLEWEGYRQTPSSTKLILQVRSCLLDPCDHSFAGGFSGIHSCTPQWLLQPTTPLTNFSFFFFSHRGLGWGARGRGAAGRGLVILIQTRVLQGSEAREIQ